MASEAVKRPLHIAGKMYSDYQSVPWGTSTPEEWARVVAVGIIVPYLEARKHETEKQPGIDDLLAELAATREWTAWHGYDPLDGLG